MMSRPSSRDYTIKRQAANACRDSVYHRGLQLLVMATKRSLENVAVMSHQFNTAHIAIVDLVILVDQTKL
jgi:hypothetical protein